MAVAFAETVVRVLAKSTATRRETPRFEDRHFKEAQKSTRSAYYISSQTAMKCPTCCREKTAFFVMRNYQKFDADMFIVLDEDWEPMLLSHAGELPGIQSNKANLRNPVKNLVDFTILDFRMGTSKWKIQ